MRHAVFVSVFHPPSPCSHASVQILVDQVEYVIRFRLTPTYNAEIKHFFQRNKSFFTLSFKCFVPDFCAS